MAALQWVLPALGLLSDWWTILPLQNQPFTGTLQKMCSPCSQGVKSCLKHILPKRLFPLKFTNTPIYHIFIHITLLSGEIIRQLSQWNLHSSLSLTPSSSQSLLPHKPFSVAFLIGFGKHLIAAVSPLHLHSLHSALPNKWAHWSINARRISFSWNFWSACLSQKKEWLDEKCAPCLQWYFMCKRLIYPYNHQIPCWKPSRALHSLHNLKDACKYWVTFFALGNKAAE